MSLSRTVSKILSAITTRRKVERANKKLPKIKTLTKILNRHKSALAKLVQVKTRRKKKRR